MALIPISPPPKEPITKDEASSNWEMWFSLLAKRVSQLIVASASAGTVTSVGLSTTGDGLAISGSPVTVAGTMSVVLDDDAAALEALSGTGGAFRTGSNTWALRVVSSGTGISVVDGNGVAGNPTIALATLADNGAGTFLKITRDGFGRVSGTAAVVAGDITGLLGTTYVNRSGDTMTGALGVVAGSSTVPGLFISGDPNTGLYSSAADTLDLATGGTQRVQINSSGNIGIPSSVSSAKLRISTITTATIGQLISGVASQTANLSEWQNNTAAKLLSITKDGYLIFGEGTVGTGTLRATASGSDIKIDIGGNNSVTGSFAYTVGEFNNVFGNAVGSGGFAFGYGNTIDNATGGGNFSSCIGATNSVTGAGGGFVFGNNNQATGDSVGIFGDSNSIGTVPGVSNANVFGNGILNNTSNSVMLGPSELAKVTIMSSGNVGISGIVPTARLHIPAGTTSANTAPIKLNSGSLNTVAEIGAVEFLADKYYAVITTGAARKELAMNDAVLTAGRVVFTTTNGRLTDDADLVFATDTLTATKLRSPNPLQQIATGASPTAGNATLAAGTVTVSTTAAKTASVIMLTRKTSGGTIGTAITYTISNGVSFTINSDNVLDTSTFSWLIVDTY